MNNEIINSEIGMIKAALDSLTDEVIASPNGGGSMLVHYIDGNPHNKLVIGSMRKGKSSIPDNPATEPLENGY